MSNPKHIFTFVSRTAPYGSSKPQLCLDAALATAVFEQSVNYVFLNDGVFQLLKDQNADPIQSKTISNALETLELYGVEKVFVDKGSLEQRQLSASDLILPAELVNSAAISDMIHKSDHVFVI